MSLAMLRGRSLVIGLLRIVGEDDRTLASVRILDVGRRQMQRADHWLVGVGAHLGQGGFPSLPGRSEGTVRGADANPPVPPDDDLTPPGRGVGPRRLPQSD